MDKKQVIEGLEAIAIYLEIKGENPFKIAAYRKAAQALEHDERTIDQIEDPKQLNGIGQGTADVIREFKELGMSPFLEELKEAIPAGLIQLLTLPGLGGKKIGRLYRELNIIDAESLLNAAKSEQIRVLSGFGQKSEEKIIEAIDAWNTQPSRLSIASVLPFAEQLEHELTQFHSVNQFSRAGSLRRLRETVKDLDYIIATTKASAVKEQLLNLTGIQSIIANGDTKVSVELALEQYAISVDFRIVLPEEFATALHHFTGSKDHNVRMRQLAKQQGEKINEYGIEDVESGVITTFETEEDFYHHFNLPYIPPEAREDGTEIDRYTNNKESIWTGDATTDLHMHTTWSDGAHSIEEMAEAAKEKGYTHIAITDHSRFLKVANGLSIERLKEQHERINEFNQQNKDFRILTGVEMDILPNGELDYPDDVLESIDFVIASIHSAFSQDQATIMARLKAAIDHPSVNLIAHPTGRLIGKREGYDVDVEQLIEWASETNTALELNASPSRLDLEVKWLKLAAKKGVALSINSDAHRVDSLNFVDYGYGQARKAMLIKDNVLNTWTLSRLKQWLKLEE